VDKDWIPGPLELMLAGWIRLSPGPFPPGLDTSHPHPGCPSSPQPPGQPALEAPDIVWAAYGHPSPRTAAEATAFRLLPWGQKIRTRL